jgi:hypothetical protein
VRGYLQDFSESQRGRVRIGADLAIVVRQTLKKIGLLVLIQKLGVLREWNDDEESEHTENERQDTSHDENPIRSGKLAFRSGP